MCREHDFSKRPRSRRWSPTPLCVLSSRFPVSFNEVPSVLLVLPVSVDPRVESGFGPHPMTRRPYEVSIAKTPIALDPHMFWTRPDDHDLFANRGWSAGDIDNGLEMSFHEIPATS